MAISYAKPTSPRFQDLTGARFGRITVVRFLRSEARAVWYFCRCDCGTEKEMRGGSFQGKVKVQSCGCLLREHNKSYATHGRSATDIYVIYQGMKSRCLNPNAHNYHQYGGRGITICDAWIKSFDQFLRDVGERPSKKHSIDRIDNNGPYAPENIKWSTVKQQGRNTRNSHILEFDGKKMAVAEWTEKLGFSRMTIYNRLKAGWSVEKTLTTPIKRTPIIA